MTTNATVHLRAIEPEDLDLLYKTENDEGLWQIGTTNVPYSRYTLHDFIANSQDDIYADRQVRLIIENSQRQVVGMADITQFDPRHLRAEVGIVVMAAQRRQGYATEALHALAEYSQHILHLHQLYAVVAADNTAALELFRKSHFDREQPLREWLFDGKDFSDAVLLQRFL